jgi:hypothetical protein
LLQMLLCKWHDQLLLVPLNHSWLRHLPLPSTTKATKRCMYHHVQSNNKVHVSSCPLSNLSMPGAFAKHYTCPLVNATSNWMVRPKQIILTECTYSSIQSLQEKLWKHSSKYTHVKNMLREAVWVYLSLSSVWFKSALSCGCGIQETRVSSSLINLLCYSFEDYAWPHWRNRLM